MKNRYLLTLCITGILMFGTTACEHRTAATAHNTDVQITGIPIEQRANPTVLTEEKAASAILAEQVISESTDLTSPNESPNHESTLSSASLQKELSMHTGHHEMHTKVALITEMDAQQIALSRVPGASDSDIFFHLDWEDGRLVYEGFILYDQFEYEFEIDAENGSIRSWEKESVFDD